MGGNSSKQGNKKYEVSHTVGGEIINTNFNNNSKGSIRRDSKKIKKNSVKIKEKKFPKKSKTVKNKELQGGNLSVIEDTSETTNENPVINSPVYRKKSSCPSCEAKDILLGKNRSRSGSEKSLRFSDFNKVLRKTRIYDWEMAPADIPLYGAEEPKPDDICYICEVYTGSHIRACRVCYLVYHDSCLTKIGHPLTDNDRRLVSANMWSCHQCDSLNHLLTQEEIKEVREELDDLDIPKENIDEAGYLKYCKHAFERDNKMFTAEREQNCVKRFHSAVKSDSTCLTYTQFLNLESIRILSRRCKDSLVHLLSKVELAEARRIFQQQDTLRTGLIPRSAMKSSSLVKKSRLKGYFPDDSIVFIDEDPETSVTWSEFLREVAIYFLSQRPNMEYTEGQCEAHDNTEDGTLTFSSCDSLDDERYNTCNSDLDPGLHTEDKIVVICHNHKNATPEEACPLGGSSTMLDEINTEIDKNHHKYEQQGKPTASARRIPSTHEEPGSAMYPQTAAQLSYDHSPKSSPNKNGGARVRGRDSGLPSEKTRSSHYNDSRHIQIPWEDVEKRADSDDNPRQGCRRSEVIPRHVTTSGQTRSVSQIACRHGKNMLAPTYGSLVGRVNSQEWKC